MMNFLCSLAVLASLCSPNLGALSILKPSQGGTGIGSATVGDVGKVLSVSDDDPFTYVLSSAGAGDVIGGSSLGTGINIYDSESAGLLRFNSISAGANISISTTSNSNTLVLSATGGTFPFTAVSYGNATSTTLGFLAGFLSTASSTINANATTTGMHSVGSLSINSERFTDLTGAGLTLSSGALTVNDVSPDMLQATDFGDFTCNGTNCSLDADTVAESELDLTAVTLADFTNDAGFLTTVDISANTNLSTTYPVVLTGDTLSLAFGTTTSNTWAGTQTFTNSPVFTSLTGGLVVSNTGSDTIFNVSTSTLGLSGPFTTTAALGNLVGGSNATINWTGLATTSNLTQSNLLFSSGGAGVTGVATTSLTLTSFPANFSGTLGALVGGANSTWTWWGLSTTSQPASSNLLVSNGTNGVYGVATNTVSCSGSVSCSSFTAISGGAITITSSGGGAGNVSTSTNEIGGRLAYWTSNSATPALLGQVATTTLAVSGPITASASIGNLVGGANVTLNWAGLATTSAITQSHLLYSSGGAGVTSVATSTRTYSGPFSTSGTLGAQVGGTNSVITWTGLATTSNLTQSNLLYSSGGAGVTGVATTSLSISGPFTIANAIGVLTNGAVTYTGLATTTAITQSHLLYSTGGAGVSSLATTSVSCSGSVSCTSFTAIGSGGAITINGTGGGSGSTAWATTTGSGGTILQYPSDITADLLFGGSSTSTAPFWWDVSASKSYVGQYAANDASITFGPNGTATTSIGIDYSNSEAFSISDSDTLGTSEWFTHLRSGLNGFGSSTPWGIFSIASSTYNYLRPMFTVGTTTDSLFSVYSTSTNQRYNGAVSGGLNGVINGTRVVVGNNGPYGWLAGLEQLWINGWWNQRDFQEFCDTPVGATAIAADGVAGCRGFSFMEDGTGTLTASTTPAASGGQSFGAITTAAASDGAGVFLNSTSAGFLTLSTSTPSMEVYARIGNSQTASSTASGNTGYVIGFTNLATAGTAYETAPTAGAFFQATSTANWQAITRTASASTQTDTGVASTTVLNGSGAFRHFKIVADVDGVDFYIRTTESGPLNKVARHTTNLPTVVLNAGVHMGRVNVGAVYATLDFYRLRVWWKSVLMQ